MCLVRCRYGLRIDMELLLDTSTDGSLFWLRIR